MAATVSSSAAATGLAEAANRHFVLRFSVATTAAFVICEWMGWQPSALAPVLTGVLLANLPFSPPFKVGLGLVIMMAASAWMTFFLTTWLGQTPHILFLALGLLMFLAFAGLAQAKAQLPLTLLLVCLAVVPVVTLTLSQYAGILPSLLVRAMILAVFLTWIAFSIWPLPPSKKQEPPASHSVSPVMAALVGVAIVLPIMLAFLLLGLTDAIPVLLTTVLLVAQIEEERSAASGVAKLAGNFIGGFIAVAAYYLLQIAPSLAALALISLLIGIGFGHQIAKGGARGGNALLAYNATMVILGLALLKGTSNSGTWAARVVQFAIACAFAVGMMRLLMPLAKKRSPISGS
jgi:hypothetical protein